MESHYARSTNRHSDSTPAETWDGDRLTTTQTESTRIQTVYLPGSFTPLLRVETATDELLKATRRSLAEVLQQDTGITLPPVLTEKLDILEQEIHRQCVSEETIQWLAGCGLSVEKMARQMDPVYIPERTIHLYHCDHRGLPQALINEDGSTACQADHDAWGNVLTETNPHKLSQLIRLPGQQYDEETALYYNRHRYYDPQQGRYITQDPIGLRGGWNAYGYPLDPIRHIHPLGLAQVCSRPLKGSRGLRTNGSTGIDLGLFHEHIFFDDGTNIGYGAENGLFSETRTNDYICNTKKHDGNVMKKAVEVVKNEPGNILFPNEDKQFGSDNYGFLLNNCQDFVSDVLDEYNKTSSMGK